MTAQKSEIRAKLDAAWTAFELDLAECIPVKARLDDAIDALRQLRQAERALADGDVKADDLVRRGGRGRASECEG